MHVHTSSMSECGKQSLECRHLMTTRCECMIGCVREVAQTGRLIQDPADPCRQLQCYSKICAQACHDPPALLCQACTPHLEGACDSAYLEQAQGLGLTIAESREMPQSCSPTCIAPWMCPGLAPQLPPPAAHYPEVTAVLTL